MQPTVVMLCPDSNSAHAVLAKETATVELTHSQQPISIMERVGGKRRSGEGGRDYFYMICGWKQTGAAAEIETVEARDRD